MARRTFIVIGIVEIRIHWKAGRKMQTRMERSVIE
jgi:hypothetical protein